jgi:hypothetical protein
MLTKSQSGKLVSAIEDIVTNKSQRQKIVDLVKKLTSRNVAEDTFTGSRDLKSCISPTRKSFDANQDLNKKNMRYIRTKQDSEKSDTKR